MADLKPVKGDIESFFGDFLSSGNAQSDAANNSGELNQEQQQHICDICGTCFPCRTYLNRHIKNVHVEVNAEHQQCPKCPMTFKKYDTFWEHVIRVHENPSSTGEGETSVSSAGIIKNPEILTADVEELVAPPQDEKEIEAFVESMVSEQDDKVCKQCDKRFCGKKNVKRHIREVHLKLPAGKTHPKRVTCQECGKTFVNNSVYNAHMRNIHLLLEPTFECSKCMRKFKELKGLRRHLRDVHKTDTSSSINPPPPPSAASKSYINTSAANNNILAAADGNEEQDPIFSCSKCQIQFVSMDGLNRHNKNIHRITTTVTPPQPEESFECLECGKRFSSKNALSGHALVHQKASLEPHVKSMLKAVFGVICNSKLTCRICGTEVLNSVEGRLHVYIKHPEKFNEFMTKGTATLAQGLSQCAYCEEKVAGLESMISHVESNHPDKYIPTCCQCGHKELKERNINLHYKQFHPEVSRYNCDVCKRQFNQRRDLTHHMKSEHSVNSVQCPYCEEKHVKVKLHVTVKHPEKAEEYTQMKKAAIREEQVARKRFNQFLEKGIIPPELKNRQSKNSKRRKKGSLSTQQQSEQDSEEMNDSDDDIDDNVEYDEDDEIVDVKPNVCFVKETPKVVIPELYALQKDSTTPHRIEVHRLPPPPVPTPPPPTSSEKIQIEENEISETDGKDNQLEGDDDEDVKPDVDQLKVCVIINPAVDSCSNSTEPPVEKTLTLSLEKLTDDQIAQYTTVAASPTSQLSTNDLTVKQVVSHYPNTSKRGRKRRRRR